MSDLVCEERSRGSGIVGRVVLAGVLVGVGYLVVRSLPDIIRYIKIERM